MGVRPEGEPSSSVSDTKLVPRYLSGRAHLEHKSRVLMLGGALHADAIGIVDGQQIYFSAARNVREAEVG